MDALVRDRIHAQFADRFATAASYAEAVSIENAIKDGALGRSLRRNQARVR